MTAASRVNAHGTMGLGRWSIYINNGFWKPRDFDVLIIELLYHISLMSRSSFQAIPKAWLASSADR